MSIASTTPPFHRRPRRAVRPPPVPDAAAAPNASVAAAPRAPRRMPVPRHPPSVTATRRLPATCPPSCGPTSCRPCRATSSTTPTSTTRHPPRRSSGWRGPSRRRPAPTPACTAAPAGSRGSRAPTTRPPATRSPASSAPARTTSSSSPAAPPTRSTCSPARCRATPRWSSSPPSTTRRCCRGAAATPCACPCPGSTRDAEVLLEGALQRPARRHHPPPAPGARRAHRGVQRHRRVLAGRAAGRHRPPARCARAARRRAVRGPPTDRPRRARRRLGRVLRAQGARPVRHRCARRSPRLAGCRAGPTSPAAARPPQVTETSVRWATGAARHEAGSPNVLGAIALAAACATIRAHRAAIEHHEARLTDRLVDGLRGLDGVTTYSLFGDDHERGPVVDLHRRRARQPPRGGGAVGRARHRGAGRQVLRAHPGRHPARRGRRRRARHRRAGQRRVWRRPRSTSSGCSPPSRRWPPTAPVPTTSTPPTRAGSRSTTPASWPRRCPGDRHGIQGCATTPHVLVQVGSSGI